MQQILSGQLIANRYKVEKSLGAGNFAEVYLVSDTLNSTADWLALKLFNRPVLNDPAVERDFDSEISKLLGFTHPNIIRLLGFSKSPSYILTEYAEEGSLANRLLPGQPLLLSEVQHYLEQICAALQTAHDLEIIHSDLKPENVLLAKGNRVLLCDFGVSVTIGKFATLRRVSEVWGTAEYTAPEAWDKKVGKPNDIYALGILLFQMLSGYLPYTGTAEELEIYHKTGNLPSLENLCPDLPNLAAFAKLIERTLAIRPEQRPHSPQQFYDWFKRALENNTPPPEYEKTAQPSYLKQASHTLTGDAGRQIAFLAGQLEQAELLEDWDTVINIGEDIRRLDVTYLPTLEKTAEAYKIRGSALYEEGNYPGALADFNQALKLLLKAEYYSWRAKIYLAMQDYKRALVELNRAINLNPGGAESYFLRGSYQFLENKLQDVSDPLIHPPNLPAHPHPEIVLKINNVLADYTVAIRLDSAQPEYYRERARCYFKILNYEQALADYSKARELDPAKFWLYDSEMATIHCLQAYLYLAQQNYPLALSEFNLAIQLDPNKSEYYVGRSQYYDLMGHSNLALEDIEKAAKLGDVKSGELAQKYLQRAKSALSGWSTSPVAGVITDLDKAIRLDPHNASYYYERGKLYTANETTHKQAIADFSQAIKLDKSQADYFFQRASLYALSTANDKVALEDLSAAIELDKTQPDYFFKMGKLLAKNSYSFKAAFDNFSKAIELDKSRADYYFERARLRAGNPETRDGAMTDFTWAIQLDKANPDYYFERAQFITMVFTTAERIEQAIEDLTEAIQYAPDRAAFYYRRSKLLAKSEILSVRRRSLDDLAKAIELDTTSNKLTYYAERARLAFRLSDYQRCIADCDFILANQQVLAAQSSSKRFMPDPAEFFYWRGMAYKNLGNKPLARESLTTALNMGYFAAQEELHWSHWLF